MPKVTLRSALPGLLGAAGAIASSYLGGRRAVAAIDRDPAFPTWKGPMPSMRVAKRKYPTGYRRRSFRRRTGRSLQYRESGRIRSIVRTSAVGSYAVAASAATAGNVDVTLSAVPTSDLITTYSEYRLKKVVRYVYARIGTDNSGLANNFQSAIAFKADPSGQAAVPTNIQDVTQTEGMSLQMINSAKPVAKFTWFPRPLSGVGGTTLGVNQAPVWLPLTAAGVAIPHYRLSFWQDWGASTSATMQTVDVYYFDVRGYT